MNESKEGGSFTWREFRKWRMLQIAALLPLIVIATFMLYFKTAPPLGVVAFFLVLIVGVVLPQICRNVIESHLILLEEIESLRKEITRRQ